MSKDIKRLCMFCQKNKVMFIVASDGSGDGESGFGPNRTVCSNSVCRAKAKEEFIDKPRREKEMNDLEDKMKDNEKAQTIIKEISSHMKSGKNMEELWTDWEKKISFLDAEDKKNIYEYQKNILLKEKSQEELKDNNQKEKCQKCHEVPINRKYYKVNGQGNYCVSCADILANGSKSNNDDFVRNAKPCDRCSMIYYEKYYSVGGKGSYCNGCADKLVEESKSNSSNNNDKNQDPPTKKNIPDYKNPNSSGNTYECGNCLRDKKDVNFASQSELDNHMKEIHGFNNGPPVNVVNNESENNNEFPYRILLIIGIPSLLLILLSVIKKRVIKKRKPKRSKKLKKKIL